MLVALAMLSARCQLWRLPAAAGRRDNVTSATPRPAGIDQGDHGDSSAGGDGGSDSGDDGGGSGDGGDGGDAASHDGDAGNAGKQAAISQRNAGGDATRRIDQSQSFGGDTFVSGGGGDGYSVSSGDVKRPNGVVSVRNVRLARTCLDAWVLALIGGVALASSARGPAPRQPNGQRTAGTDALSTGAPFAAPVVRSAGLSVSGHRRRRAATRRGSLKSSL